MVKVVSVQFKNSPKSYDYHTDLPLNVNDLVVVPAGSFYSVAKVKKVKTESPKAEKWVVQRVDLQEYQHRLEMEAIFA